MHKKAPRIVIPNKLFNLGMAEPKKRNLERMENNGPNY